MLRPVASAARELESVNALRDFRTAPAEVGRAGVSADLSVYRTAAR